MVSWGFPVLTLFWVLSLTFLFRPALWQGYAWTEIGHD